MEMFNDLCTACKKGSFDKCKTDFDKIQLDDITRKVVSCADYEEKQKYHLKVTYECDNRIAVVEQDVYKLPDVKWKESGLGEFKNVFISDNDIEKLKRDYPHEYKDGIEALSEYIAMYPQRGKKYKSHYAVVRKWLNGDSKKRKEREAENKKREQERQNRNRLQSPPSYDIEKIKRAAMENTEI